jgi:hypothetical protein
MSTIHRIAEAASAPVGWKQIQNKLSAKQRKGLDPAALTAAMHALADQGYGQLEIGARGAATYKAAKPLPI